MAKRKSRAARKEQRVRVSRAEAHGLPAPELPQPVKKAPRDATVRDEYARKSPAAAGARAERVAAANQSSGLPTIYKVLIGAAAAIGLIFGLSQLRKSDPAATQESTNQEASQSADLSTPGLTAPVSDEASVAVNDTASDLERAASAEDAEDSSSDANLVDAVQEVRGASESSAAQDEAPLPAATPTIVAPAADFAAPAKSKAAVTASPSPAIEAQAVAPKIVAPSEPRAPSVEKPVVARPSSPTVTQPPSVTAPVTPQAPTTPQAPKTPAAPPTPEANESE